MQVEKRTRGKRLLELLGLVRVLEDKGVDVPRAADLELDVVDLLVLLDARGCHSSVAIHIRKETHHASAMQGRPKPRRANCTASLASTTTPPPLLPGIARVRGADVHWASLRRQISMNCLMSETSEGILAAVGGRVVKISRFAGKFAKVARAGCQIVVVSLIAARTFTGQCRVRTRRGWRVGSGACCGGGKTLQVPGTRPTTRSGGVCEHLSFILP